MVMKLEFQWEEIGKETYRSKVFGGWLLLHKSFVMTEKSNKMLQSESMVFIADRDWQWQILPPPVNLQAAKSKLAKEYKPKEKD